MRAFTLDSFERPPGPREDLPTPEARPGHRLGCHRLLRRRPGPRGACPRWARPHRPGRGRRPQPPPRQHRAGHRGHRRGRRLRRPARRQGRRTVIASGLPEDHDYLRGLGAAEVLDRNGDIATQARQRHPDGVDALLDLTSRPPTR